MSAAPETLSELTDDELDAERAAVAAELERRRNRALIPAQITELATAYRAAGGDPADLTPYLEPPTE